MTAKKKAWLAAHPGYMAAACRRMRAKRALKGVCTCCGDPAVVEGTNKCQTHLDARRAVAEASRRRKGMRSRKIAAKARLSDAVSRGVALYLQDNREIARDAAAREWVLQHPELFYDKKPWFKSVEFTEWGREASVSEPY